MHGISHELRKAESQKVTLIGSILDGVLGLAKVIVGYLFHSHALIIDGIHSFTDLFTDFFVLFIGRIANEKPDEEHPYGHEKFETIGTAALGSILLGTAGALLYETVEKLLNQETTIIPGWPTLLVALLSILGKEAIYHYTKKTAEKINSSLLMANAWHSRTDAISSVVVLLGLLLSLYGYPWVDNLAAILVALLIAKVGWDFIRESLSELAESSLDSNRLQEIKTLIESVDGVEDAHALRTRKMGPKILLDVNVEVNNDITVSEGHEISAWVAKTLKEQNPDIADVTVHIDVEDDMDDDYSHSLSNLLPLRKNVREKLDRAWKDHLSVKYVKDFRFHYIDRKIEIEIILDSEILKEVSKANLKQELEELAQHYEWFSKVRLLFN